MELLIKKRVYLEMFIFVVGWVYTTSILDLKIGKS